MPQYFAEGTHEAIIDKETFEKVQESAKQRSRKRKPLLSDCFSGIIKCENCGKSFHRTTDRNGRKRWICRSRIKGISDCKVGTLTEDVLFRECTLGLDDFDVNIFKEKIDFISIPIKGWLNLHFKDGHVEVRQWQK